MVERLDAESEFCFLFVRPPPAFFIGFFRGFRDNRKQLARSRDNIDGSALLDRNLSCRPAKSEQLGEEYNEHNDRELPSRSCQKTRKAVDQDFSIRME